MSDERTLDLLEAKIEELRQLNAGDGIDLSKEIERRIPVDPIRKLKQQLARAVAAERYEEAAAIRDRLKQMSTRAQGDDSCEPAL